MRRKVTRKKAGRKVAVRKAKTSARKKVTARTAVAKRSAPVRGIAAKAKGKTTGRKKVAAARKTAPAGRGSTRRKAATRAVARKAGVARKVPVRRKVVRAPPPVLGLDRILAWRMRRQQLEQPALRPPADLSVTLARTGWLNSPSGSTPYLALAARYASFARHDLDRAVFQEGLLVELPAVRGTTMIVPVEDAWLALQAYQPRHEARVVEIVRRRRLMTRIELQNLEDVVRAVLAGCELSAGTLRRKVPVRLVRELGEAGQRQGVGTTVDLALRNLVARGDAISRKSEGRLDRSSYRYVLRRDLLGPVTTADMRPRPEEVFLAELASHYFQWAGPARLADFAWWAGVTQAAARAGVKGAKLAGLKVREIAGDWFVGVEDLAALLAFATPDPPGVALVPFRDSLTGSWKTFEGLLRGADLTRSLVGWGGKPVPAREAGPSGAHHHFIVVGGRIAGAWEHGTDGGLRYAAFEDLGPALEPLVARRAAAMAEFICRELGETRYYAGELGRSLTLEVAAESWTGSTALIAPRS